MVITATTYFWPNKVVLIVDDDFSSLYLLKAILSKTGVSVVLAEDGEAAIDIIKNNLTIDLVLMDIKLKGISGLDTTQQIKQLKPNLPIIAQTACVVSGDMEKCYQAGCSAYLTKPLSSEKLLETIDYYFRRNVAFELIEQINNN